MIKAKYTNGAPLEGAPWFDQNWMFLGPILVTIVSVAYSRLWKERIRSRRFFHWTLALWYVLHQWEEHAWDITGKRYPFIEWFNAFAHAVAGEPNDGTVQGIVTVRLITLINVPLVWFLFPLGAWYADRISDIPILVLWSVSAFNALIAHVIFGFAMTEGVYNPGMLQSFFMGGAGLYYLIFLRSLHRRPKLAICSFIASGPIFHGLLLALPAAIMRNIGYTVGSEFVFVLATCTLTVLVLGIMTKIFHTEGDISPPMGSDLQIKMASKGVLTNNDGGNNKDNLELGTVAREIEIKEK